MQKRKAMKKIKVVSDYHRFSIPKFIEFIRNTVTMMTNNPKLANPDVSLADMTTAVDNLEVRYNAAVVGGPPQTALLHTAYDTALNLVDQQANYVNRTAKGDASVILGGGFHISKQPGPAIRPVFWAITGNEPGEALVGCKAMPKSRAYVWQYCVSDEVPADDAWKFAGASTQRKMALTNLDIGHRVWFRVCGVTSKGMLPYLDPIMLYIA
jgi:hypothetical protein